MTLKEARQWAHMTIEELAKKAGISPAAICRYENGQRTPRVKNAKRLASILGIPWPDIVDNRSADTGSKN